MTKIVTAPWEGLGGEVSNKMSPKEMMIAADLNWKVEKAPIFLSAPQYKKDADGKEYPSNNIKDRYALKRKDKETVFDIVSHRFNEVQNEECFDFFTKFAKEGKLTMETAGNLDEGKRLWALAKMKHSFDLPGKDQIDSYLLLANQHKAGRALTIMYTPIRVRCKNTLAMALREGKRGGDAFYMPRSRKLDDDIKAQAELALGLAGNQQEQFEEAAKFLCKKKAVAQDVDQYFADLFQPELKVADSDDYNRTVTKLRIAYVEQPGAELSSGSWWQALNAVTYYIDHEANKTATTDNQNNRLRNAWFGHMAAKKHKALDKALEYAKRV